ncbi:flagellar protein FlaG [Clostridium sp.]|uniref:flagellar protein FlaG n=1 Tax=Clostridium sp. TaxID=1506 RepID=UPI002FCB8DE3
MDVIGISQGRQNSMEYGLNQKVINNDEVKNLNHNENAEGNFSEENIKKSVEKLNKFLEDEKVHAVYERHEKFNQIMIKIVDNDTKEVIAEYPPKKILDMVAKMCEMVGILIDKKG